MLFVALEDPGGLDIAPLIAQSDFYSASLYPPESRHQADVGSLATANTRFFVARSARVAVGCGALVIGNDGTAELKRMLVDPKARGQGIGRALLQALEAAARGEGVRLIQLEIGVRSTQALRLYRRFGYVDRGPSGNYPHDALSVFMEKLLS